MGKVKWLGKGAVILFILSLALLTTAMFTAVAQEKPKAEPPKIESAKPAQGAVVGNNLGLGGKLGPAIAKTPAGKGKGQIDVSAPRGAFGIPGAPDISYVLAIFWAVWVGWIFSTVGAFGGIMAGVGHITVYGLGDYAKSFKDTSPALNKTLTDSIRTSNQFLVGLSALISTINYLKSKRLAWPLGIALALGSIAGAVFIPMLTGGKISFRQYQGWFGVFVFVVGAVLVYELTPTGQKSKKAAKAAAQAFEKSVKEKKDISTQGVTLKKFGITKSTFTFFGSDFDFNPIWAFIGGIVSRSGRRVPLCPVSYLDRWRPDVCGGGHFSICRAYQHADQHRRLHYRGKGRYGLESHRHRTGGHLRRIHDRTEDPEIHSGQVAEDHLHHSGSLCRSRLFQPGVLRTEMGTDVNR